MVILETNTKHTFHIKYLFIVHKVKVCKLVGIQSRYKKAKLPSWKFSIGYRKEIQMNPL